MAHPYYYDYDGYEDEYSDDEYGSYMQDEEQIEAQLIYTVHRNRNDRHFSEFLFEIFLYEMAAAIPKDKASITVTFEVLMFCAQNSVERMKVYDSHLDSPFPLSSNRSTDKNRPVKVHDLYIATAPYALSARDVYLYLKDEWRACRLFTKEIGIDRTQTDPTRYPTAFTLPALTQQDHDHFWKTYSKIEPSFLDRFANIVWGCRQWVWSNHGSGGNNIKLSNGQWGIQKYTKEFNLQRRKDLADAEAKALIASLEEENAQASKAASKKSNKKAKKAKKAAAAAAGPAVPAGPDPQPLPAESNTTTPGQAAAAEADESSSSSSSQPIEPPAPPTDEEVEIALETAIQARRELTLKMQQGQALDRETRGGLASAWILQNLIVVSTMLKTFNAAEEKRRIAVEKARQKAIREAKRRGRVEARIKKVLGPSLDINTRQTVIRRLVEKAKLVALEHAQKPTTKVTSKLSKDKDKSRSTQSSAAVPGSASASASSRPSATQSSKSKESKGSTAKSPTKEQQELIDVFLSEYVRVVALRLQPCAPGALQFMLMGGIMGEIEPLFLKSWDGSKTVRSNVSAFLDQGLESGQITPADARQLMQYFDEIPSDRKKWTPWELGGFVAGGIGAVGMGSRTYGSWGLGGDVLGEGEQNPSPFAGNFPGGLDSDFEDDTFGCYQSEGSVPDWETVTEDEGDESSEMDSDDDVPDAETATEDEDEEEETDDSDVPDWESMTESEDDDDSHDDAGAATGRAGHGHGQGRTAGQKDEAQGSARGQGSTSTQSSKAGSSHHRQSKDDEEAERNRIRKEAELENRAREAEADKLLIELQKANEKRRARNMAEMAAEAQRAADERLRAKKEPVDREAKAKAERAAKMALLVAVKEKAVRERLAREEAARLAKEKAERLAREKKEQERVARLEAMRLAQEKAERVAREKAERLAREKAERLAREKAERLAREKAERLAREKAERLAREKAERLAREEVERLAREKAEHRAKEEAERLAKEKAEQRAKEEAERLAKEKAEQRAKQEAELLAKQEAERLAKEKAERLAREEVERLAREKAEHRAREEAERLAREDSERLAREKKEQERLAIQKAVRLAQEKAERLAREKSERLAREESERLAREEVDRLATEEADTLARESADQLAPDQLDGEEASFVEEAQQDASIGLDKEQHYGRSDESFLNSAKAPLSAFEEVTSRILQEKASRNEVKEAERTARLRNEQVTEAAQIHAALKESRNIQVKLLSDMVDHAAREVERLRALALETEDAAQQARYWQGLAAECSSLRAVSRPMTAAEVERGRQSAYSVSEQLGRQYDETMEAKQQRDGRMQLLAFLIENIRGPVKPGAEAVVEGHVRVGRESDETLILVAEQVAKDLLEAQGVQKNAENELKRERKRLETEVLRQGARVKEERKWLKRLGDTEVDKVRARLGLEAAALAKLRGEPVRLPNNGAVYYDWRGVNAMLSLWLTPTAAPLRQMDALVRHYDAMLRPSEGMMLTRHHVLENLQLLFDIEFPDAGLQLRPFGSYVTGLGNTDSDIDICVFAEHYDPHAAHSDVVHLASVLRQQGFANVRAIPDAKVPIVKFVDPHSGIACDMNVQHPLGIYNSALIKAYLEIDARLSSFLFLLKHFAKVHGILDASAGYLCSYAFILMAIVFFQEQKDPILPRLQSKLEKPRNFDEHKNRRPPSPTFGAMLLDGKLSPTFVHQDGKTYEINYDTRTELYKSFGTLNTKSVARLLFEFFEYFARLFDYRTMEVSPMNGHFQERHVLAKERRQQEALKKLSGSSTSGHALESLPRTSAYTFDSKRQLWVSEVDKAYFRDLDTNNGLPSGAVPIPGSVEASVDSMGASAAAAAAAAAASTRGGYQDRFGSDSFFCVMDPFMLKRNVAGTCRGAKLAKVWKCFDHAYRCLALGQFEEAFKPLPDDSTAA